MPENLELIDRVKKDLDNIIDPRNGGLAFLANNGKTLYSELPQDVEQKLLLFKPSYPSLNIGSNITIAIQNGSLIVMRASQTMLIAVQTQQNVGSSLGKISTVVKKYSQEFNNPQNIIKPSELRVEVVKKEALVVEGEETELTEPELEKYQKSLVYELIPPLTPDNVTKACPIVWSKATRLMLRNLDQNLTVDEIWEGLKNAGFDVSLEWVLEALQSLAARGIVRIKEKNKV